MLSPKKNKLAPVGVFYRRLWKNALFGLFLMALSLLLGVIGYKLTIPSFDWYDSLLNASMILSGMGPMMPENITLSHSAKVFASIYALFSGVTFITTIGILIAPIAHRFFHRLHLEDTSGE